MIFCKILRHLGIRRLILSRYDLNEVSPAELLLDGLKKSWIFASSFRLFISSNASQIDLLIFFITFKTFKSRNSFNTYESHYLIYFPCILETNFACWRRKFLFYFRYSSFTFLHLGDIEFYILYVTYRQLCTNLAEFGSSDIKNIKVRLKW